MMHDYLVTRLRGSARATIFLFSAVLLVVATAIPAFPPDRASAAQLTSRKVTINNSKVSVTDVEHIFSYTIGNTTSTKAGIIYEFCTTPLGTCTLPTGMVVQAATHDSQASWPTNGTAFTAHAVANEGDCTMTTNAYMMCFERDETVATGVTGGAVTHTISGITAPSAVQSVYVRISLYSDDDFGSGDKIQSSGTDDAGVVAEAFVDQLTISGRVQERLDFCMAAIDDDDTLPANVSTCTALTDSGIDIGTVDNTSISRSPVEPSATNGADDDYGIAMINTNASNGVVLAYYADAATSVSGGDTDQLRAFRVLPANCDATETIVDQCINSAEDDADGSTFAINTENFGMYVPCINVTQGSTTGLGSVPDRYNGTDNSVAEGGNCEGAETSNLQYAWRDSAVADTLASSASVVDDEIVKLNFAAAAASTTPTGTYVVLSIFIATATY